MKIIKLKNGKYSTRAYLGLDHNKKQIVERFSADTITELKKMIMQRRLDLANDTRMHQETSVTLDEAFNMFITARDNVLSPTTLRAYRSIQHNSFRSIMHMPITEIRSEDIQREINEMTPFVSAKTIKNKLSLLNAVIEKYSGETPGKKVNLPQRKKEKTIKIPTEEEVNRMINFCHQDPYYKEYELPIILAAYCGLRRGEIGALEYSDIDFRKGSLNISKAQILTSDHEHQIKPPKTDAGYRSVPLNDYAMALIKKRKKEGRPLISVNISQISSVFKTIRKHTGVSCRFHDLRHFFASLLLANNVPDLYAIELTGHSTTAMLKTVYQHTIKEKQNEVRELVKGFYKG